MAKKTRKQRKAANMALPDASATRAFAPQENTVPPTPMCHGCGRTFPAEQLKRCTKCIRVAYCSRDCQVSDWKKPSLHKQCCQVGLLDTAMNNIYRLPIDQKLGLMMQGLDPPNGHLNQSIAKVSCKNMRDFLSCAEKEIAALQKICTMAPLDAVRVRGNSQMDHSDFHGYGLDIGVESLCLSLCLWPGVYTVNSCSSLHAGAFVPGGDGGFVNPTAVVSYVCDDVATLQRIHEIVVVGALGIRFENLPSLSPSDKVRNMQGFCVIDCLVDGKPSSCRTYRRDIQWASKTFDILDDALWREAKGGKPPFSRIQNNLIGCVGLALQLAKANSYVGIAQAETEKIDSLVASATALRLKLIERGNERFGLQATTKPTDN